MFKNGVPKDFCVTICWQKSKCVNPLHTLRKGFIFLSRTETTYTFLLLCNFSRVLVLNRNIFKHFITTEIYLNVSISDKTRLFILAKVIACYQRLTFAKFSRNLLSVFVWDNTNQRHLCLRHKTEKLLLEKLATCTEDISINDDVNI